jgi:DNA-binding NarL/FixJ family response regulator
VSKHPLRVAVVSRHELTRAGLVTLLAHDPARALVFDVSAQDGHLGGQDVAIYDLAGLVETDSEDLRHLLSSRAPVVVLVPHSRPDLGDGALAAGVAEVIRMDVTAQDLLDVLERVAAGGAAPRRSARETTHAHLVDAFGLSAREIEILDEIASGKRNQQIAQDLYLSINSIKSYVRSAYKKIGAGSRSQAVLWSVQHGLGRREQQEGRD